MLDWSLIRSIIEVKLLSKTLDISESEISLLDQLLLVSQWSHFSQYQKEMGAHIAIRTWSTGVWSTLQTKKPEWSTLRIFSKNNEAKTPGAKTPVVTRCENKQKNE